MSAHLNKSKCKICDSADIKILVADRKRFPEFSILKCKKCGLVFLQDYSSDRAVNSEDEYWKNNSLNVSIYSDPEVNVEVEKRYKKYLEEITKIINKKGRLLDFGCGIGNFVSFAVGNGWDAYGIDLSSRAIEYARKRNLNVRQGSIEKSGFQDDFFDVITMWDVIEHFDKPVSTTRSLCNKLKDGGLLVIETPLEDNIIRKLTWALYRISGGNISLLSYFYYPVHRFYFSKKAMTKMLKNLNMEIVSIFRESTFLSKAKLKIQTYKLPFRKFIVAMLPFIFLLGNIFGAGNKIIVLARKKA